MMGDAMSDISNAMTKLEIRLELKDFQELGVTPWFSYTTSLPERPLPSLSERPHFKTERLLIRPIVKDDLESFYELRQITETQEHSKIRGRPDRSKEETAQYIEALAENEDNHWYFGAFLLSTGEMIGEGGLPDCAIMSTSNSGWPEAEFLVKPQYWRQGYGTEMFHAIIDSWWDLPREWRRLQLIPALNPGVDAGSDVPECLVYQWEERNERARDFFAHVLDQAPAAAEGVFESCDTREGREGEVVKWAGTLAVNPRPPLETWTVRPNREQLGFWTQRTSTQFARPHFEPRKVRITENGTGLRQSHTCIHRLQSAFRVSLTEGSRRQQDTMRSSGGIIILIGP